MFTSPPEQRLEWSDSAVEGAYRFMRRLWRMVHTHLKDGAPVALDPAALNDAQQSMRRATHETIKRVSDDVGRRYKFNTAIAAVMELANALQNFEDDSPQGVAVTREAIDTIVRLLSPITPHVSHALFAELGHAGSVIDASWPQVDEAALTRNTVDLVVQVNGKLRAKISVSADADRDAIEAEARGNENVQRFIEGKTLRKVIVVPGRLVNIVV